MRLATGLLLGALGFVALCVPAAAEGKACDSLVFPGSDALLGAPGAVTPALLTQWIAGSVPGAFSYSFADEGGIGKPCAFTDTAWAKFRGEMDIDGFEGVTKSRNAIGSAVLSMPPVLYERGIGEDGAYAWKVEVGVVPWWESPAKRTAGPPRYARLVLKKVLYDEGGASLRVVDVMPSR